MKHLHTLFGFCVLFTLLLSGTHQIEAQVQFPKNSKPKGAPIKTTVSVTLLTETTSSALFAQQWGRIFRDLKVSVRTRRSVLDDKPSVEQNVRGTFREVRLVGVLDRNGEIHFPGHRFARQDLGKLKEWLNELKTYGAQGSPESKPVWGLSEKQFKTVFEALAEPAPANVQGLTLKAAITKLDLPQTLPVRFDVDAEKRLAADSQMTVISDLEKLAKGTVLAIALKQYGLAFHPSRTPSGSLELAVAPWESKTAPWPIGWDLKNSRQKTAPRYFQLIPVELTNVPLRDVLLAASKASGIPMITDEYEIKKKNVDLDKIMVTIPNKRTTWGILIGNAIGRDGLTRKLVIDERGQPFIWITVFKPRVSPATR
ncbi:MAG: hypothetical protein K0U86_18100 [Planctomycetes bacterium]|nr:hypothetical protein [Planctomycetota bacterium]MCH9726819.1 hypothetical protein [Planctomycetota bacterium]MCH9775503.1 hypothetical protein [Planctomycetota bacterium]MCH9790612.1 hypothetical protein [Planctomycetota bacterium]